MPGHNGAWTVMLQTAIPKDLETRAYEVFVYPTLGLIDTKCKELGLRDETTKRAKELAIEYIRKTYHNPDYSHIKFLLPAFVQIASVLNNDRRKQRDIASVFGVTVTSIRKWYMHIVDILNIDIALP